MDGQKMTLVWRKPEGLEKIEVSNILNIERICEYIVPYLSFCIMLFCYWNRDILTYIYIYVYYFASNIAHYLVFFRTASKWGKKKDSHYPIL